MSLSVRVTFFCLLLSALFFSGCTSKYRLESVVDKQVGKAQMIEKTRLELDKLLGQKDSVLKRSVLELVSSRMRVNYETIIDGKRARVHVRATVPKMDEMNTLLLLASFMPKDQMLNMTVQELFSEVSKNSRRPASLDDLRTEVYEFSVDFHKSKDWIVNTDHLRRAYSRKNLLSRN